MGSLFTCLFLRNGSLTSVSEMVGFSNTDTQLKARSRGQVPLPPAASSARSRRASDTGTKSGLRKQEKELKTPAREFQESFKIEKNGGGQDPRTDTRTRSLGYGFAKRRPMTGFTGFSVKVLVRLVLLCCCSAPAAATASCSGQPLAPLGGNRFSIQPWHTDLLESSRQMRFMGSS